MSHKNRKKNRHHHLRNRHNNLGRRTLTKHHLIPKSRGGNKSEENLLQMWSDKHHLWHELWGNRTIDEIIVLLQKIKSMKKESVK
jgi:hypothetical protein